MSAEVVTQEHYYRIPFQGDSETGSQIMADIRQAIADVYARHGFRVEVTRTSQNWDAKITEDPSLKETAKPFFREREV